MIQDERNKPLNTTEDQQVRNDNSASSATEKDKQQTAIDNNESSPDNTNSEGQEGWVAVGSGLGIDE